MVFPPHLPELDCITSPVIAVRQPMRIGGVEGQGSIHRLTLPRHCATRKHHP